jgi:nucleotide-binding universal stress UspA family protein
VNKYSVWVGLSADTLEVTSSPAEAECLHQVEEEPLPLWQAITTHTPRHSGADLVLLGSGGDQNLKEVTLGHLAGGLVYAYDTLDR